MNFPRGSCSKGRWKAACCLGWALATAASAADCRQLLRDAQQAVEARKWESAIAGFQSALAACPETVPIRISLAQALYLGGQDMEAERYLRDALATDPRRFAALYALGRIHYTQHRYQEAAEDLEKAAAVEPDNYRAHDNLALCYDALNRDADAIRHYKRALDLVVKDHPDYDWAYANFAEFFLKREQYEKAFQLAAEAAQRNPASARDAFLTGKALSKLDKPALSLRWLEQAVKLDPQYGEAWYVLAQCYRKAGRAAESQKALERFREVNKSAAKNMLSQER